MSTWTSPATWTNGAVTAASMNTEIRDHLLFIKGALDLLTGSTTADTGTSMALSITRTSLGDVAAGFQRSGDTNARVDIQVSATSRIRFGPGSAGPDASLFRDGATGLSVDNASGGSTEFRVYSTTSGDAYNIGVLVTGDNYRRVAFGLSGGKPRVAWGTGSATPDLYLTRDTTGRLLATASSGGARIGAELDTTGSDTNSLFAWVSGDTQPRSTIGIHSTGSGKLGLGPGGSTAPDATMYRTAANLVQTDFAFDLRRSSTSNGVLIGRVDGDGSSQFTIYARGHANFTDGVSTFVKAGVPADGDFRATPPSGTIAVDTTNSRLYARVGSTWKYAALT